MIVKLKQSFGHRLLNFYYLFIISVYLWSRWKVFTHR